MSRESCLFGTAINHCHRPIEMLPSLFRGELAGQLAGFCGQTAPGGCFRIVGFLWRGALRLFHNGFNLPFFNDVVKTGQMKPQCHGRAALRRGPIFGEMGVSPKPKVRAASQHRPTANQGGQ